MSKTVSKDSTLSIDSDTSIVQMYENAKIEDHDHFLNTEKDIQMNQSTDVKPS